MRFTKMHGIGNDYVYVDAFHETVADPSKLATQVSDRHIGIGSDGLILVAPPTDAGKSAGATVRMRMFNADGSESEMCGNGVRCVAKYAHDHGLSAENPMHVETGNGVLTLALQIGGAGKVESVTVDMGEPILALAEIPVERKWLTELPLEHVWGVGDAASATAIPATFVSMGNPHAVIFVDDVSLIDLAKLGAMLENHRAFPRRINVHFVQVHSPTELTMRTWERGSGITLACGTGAAAVCVAGVLTGKSGRTVNIHLPGGDLQLEWREAGNHVMMTGPAVEVFSGEWLE
jgi:diaminopimelate epimerase